MTLRPALARLERGYRRMWGWIVAKVRGARAYRYDGEEATHAEQLRETQISLAMMAGADAGDPDQMRMASDIENGAENRLTVLLGKARLSIAEKRERDAIQTGIAKRRQGFAEPHLVRRDGTARPARFAALSGFLGGWQVWVLAGAVTISGWGVAAVQAAIKERVEDQRDEARAEARQNAASAAAWRERSEHYRTGLIDAAEVARQAAGALEAERAAVAARAARERRRNREIANVLADRPEPPAWSLRDDAVDEPGGGGAADTP